MPCSRQYGRTYHTHTPTTGEHTRHHRGSLVQVIRNFRFFTVDLRSYQLSAWTSATQVEQQLAGTPCRFILYFPKHPVGISTPLPITRRLGILCSRIVPNQRVLTARFSCGLPIESLFRWSATNPNNRRLYQHNCPPVSSTPLPRRWSCTTSPSALIACVSGPLLPKLTAQQPTLSHN